MPGSKRWRIAYIFPTQPGLCLFFVVSLWVSHLRPAFMAATFSSESNRGGESRAEQCLAFCFYYLSLKSDVSTWWATWLRARGNLSFCQHRISRILIVHSTYTELTWTPRPRPRPLKVVEHFVLPSKLRKELALFAFVVRAKKKTVHVIQVMRMRVRACACVRCTRMLESTK